MAPPGVQKHLPTPLFLRVCTYKPEDSRSLCASRAKSIFEFSNRERYPISGFSLVRGPDKQIIPILKFLKTPASNCHAHTAQQIPALKKVVDIGDYLDPLADMGVNPAALMLYGATLAIATNLPADPESLSKSLVQLGLRTGDILIWRDPQSSNLFHSTTLMERSAQGWITNNKWGTLPVKIEPLRDVIQYSMDQVNHANMKRRDPELEFESYLNLRGIPEELRVDVRRPR